MGIKVNKSDDVVVSNSSLYTGVTKVVVVAINPTKAEMEAMGMKPQNDPVYKGEDGKMRLDFYVKSVDGKARGKASFWLEPKIRTNQSGDKVQWVNKFGTFAWSPNEQTVPQYDWFKTEGARPAYVGEEQLCGNKGFIPNWANLGLDEQCIFDDVNAIIDNNIKELKDIHAAIPNNEVKVLFGVKDAKYQDIYTKFFQRASVVNYKAWETELKGQYSEFKSDFQNSLEFKAYVGSTELNMEQPTDMENSGGEPKEKKKYNF